MPLFALSLSSASSSGPGVPAPRPAQALPGCSSGPVHPDGLPARCAGETSVIRVLSISHQQPAAFNCKSAGRPSGTGSLRLSLTTTRPVFLRHHPGAPSRRRGERNEHHLVLRQDLHEAPCPVHSAEVWWRSVGRFPARKGGRRRAVAGEPGGEFHRQSSCSARPLPPPFLCAALAEAATSAGGRWVSLWTSQGVRASCAGRQATSPLTRKPRRGGGSIGWPD